LEIFARANATIVLAWSVDAAVEFLQGECASLLKFISLFTRVITIGVASVASGMQALRE
jgi:hypothetical protein